jgi:hypothetical protein
VMMMTMLIYSRWPRVDDNGAGSQHDLVCCVPPLSFFLNGESLGTAFENMPTHEQSGGYYAAVSLDEGEAVRVNIGHRPFGFPSPAGDWKVIRRLGCRTMDGRLVLRTDYSPAAY